MSTRMKLIGMSILLCIALGAVVFCAVQAVQAVQRLQAQRRLTQIGDVSTIRSWMTLHYIAHVYQVPESYLDESLHISNPLAVRRVPLHSLAYNLNLSINQLIHDVQQAILAYRSQHTGLVAITDYTWRAQAPPVTGRSTA